MRLLQKQIYREMGKNKVFLSFILILMSLTSFMYFFVQFSIDKNLGKLNAVSMKSENQKLYEIALHSNGILAVDLLIMLTVLTVFVLFMFFYYFFKNHRKQIGCLRALGFEDKFIQVSFIKAIMVLSVAGTIVGIAFAYFATDVLLDAGAKSYSMTGLIKGLNLSSILLGSGIPFLSFTTVAYLSYYFIKKKETALLLSGAADKKAETAVTNCADWITDKLPGKHKFSIRIALRKPATIFLILIAVMSFSTMFILGYSLNLSSQKVFDSQTEGHNYKYETFFEERQLEEKTQEEIQYFIDTKTTMVVKNGQVIEQTLVGIEAESPFLELENEAGEKISVSPNGVIIGLSLKEMYGLKIGDMIQITMEGVTNTTEVSDIAWNAKKNCIYTEKGKLAAQLGVSENAYTGMLSLENVTNKGHVISDEEKRENLDREAVSNKSSAVINHLIGCAVGCILIFLALFMNFQSSTRDIVVLHLLGYRVRDIHKTVIDIYLPIIVTIYWVTVLPCIAIVQSIHKTLSLQTNDYMPFQTNFLVILFVFILLIAIYSMVKGIFYMSVNRMIVKEQFIVE